MTPEGFPSQDEFLKQIQETRLELDKIRSKAWLEAKKAVEDMLTLAGLEKGTPTFTAIFTLIQATWVQGYNTGAQDLSKYMMREMGLGNVVGFTETLAALQQKIAESKLENN